MDLTIYDIIQGPVISDKAQKLNTTFQKLVLKVHPHSNKPLIKEAIEKLFNVKVDNVRVMVRKGKLRRVGKFEVQGKLQKKAVVTLKEGYTIDLFGHQGAPAQTPIEKSE